MPSPLDSLKSFKVQSSKMEVAKHELFQPASKGPFRCDHCEYFREPERCLNKDLIAYRKGNSTVQPGDCCDYYESNGKKGS